MAKANNELVVRGNKVGEDTEGRLCLDDIWAASGERETRAPARWRQTDAAKRLIRELQKNITSAALKTKTRAAPVIYAKAGRGNRGTFAHPILAAAYAGYLNAKLEIEVRTVWLRYRAGDATLADEILQRASKEANAWAGIRALGRSQRNTYTDVLKAHGVQDKGYMECTETVYLQLLGGRSWQLRATRSLPVKSNLRNHLDTAELSFVMAAEALAGDRITEEESDGNAECVEATRRSASFIREAIDRDRRDRQRKII